MLDGSGMLDMPGKQRQLSTAKLSRTWHGL